ncbi:hypothetical protein AJ80_08606 [Polytolypa hystricis UAMH7299]|uniref:alcohol O-acetyltransferase n=1 Tax=Polytolypa hystricis (strain UAMH7299) TaxID=1447883 RepID=A0A2B7WWZ9_POLH7|nr:hypothetical protein AJ80_08606 [Polytolypa hystricis UAMH7299]
MSFLSSLLPSGKVSFHHAPKPVLLRRKKSGDTSDSEQSYISLADVCKTATPQKCQLNPLLFNGHLQTAWTVVNKDDVQVYYKRWTFKANNENYSGTFDVDFVVEPYESTSSDEKPNSSSTSSSPDSDLPPRTSFYTPEEFSALPSTDTRPMLIILHGLSGGSHELYLRHVVEPLLQQGEWAACVVNFRGCANSKVSSPILYNARATYDVRQMVQWVREKFPNRKLFGIGFSLGANVLTNYLGEEGDKCHLEAAVICSSPWNLEVSSLALQRTWVGLEIYSRTMGSNMKRLFEKHAKEISEHPRVEVERIRDTTYLHEFDREIQCPVWGYPTENAYYRDASSVDSIFGIKIPFFVINAEDDPISVKEALPYNEIKKTPYGVMCTTSWGGHLSWFEYGGSRWFTKPVVKFLNTMAHDIDHSVPRKLEKDDTHQTNNVPEPGTPINIPSVGPAPDFQPMRRKLGLPIVR